MAARKKEYQVSFTTTTAPDVLLPSLAKNVEMSHLNIDTVSAPVKTIRKTTV